jgi:hypothetical protein
VRARITAANTGRQSGWVAVLVVALLASTLVGLARRVAEADQRRRVADLAAESGRVVADRQAAL